MVLGFRMIIVMLKLLLLMLLNVGTRCNSKVWKVEKFAVVILDVLDVLVVLESANERGRLEIDISRKDI